MLTRAHTLGLVAASIVIACSAMGDDALGEAGGTGANASESGASVTTTGVGSSSGSASSDATSPTGEPTTTSFTTETSGEAETATGDPVPPPVLDDCIDDGAAGDHVYTCGDLTFDVMVPDACLGWACGLVIDVHGFTMSGRMQDNNTNLRALGAERGYIVVQPNANPAPPSASWVPDVDDDKVVDFTERMIAAFHVDPTRVHFTGFSQGGYMSWRMICDHADLFASVAPAAACEAELGIRDCGFAGDEVPSQAIPILYMHGTADALVPFDCAEPRRDAIVTHFSLGEPEVLSEGADYTWTRYAGSEDALLEFIEHDYAAAAAVLRGHCYPGSTDPADVTGQLFGFDCQGETAFNWGVAVMDFFEAHPG